MSNFNKVILMGRLTADPELRRTNSGIPVASFGLAINRQGGNDTADFPDCVAWRQTAEFISKYFQKGKEIMVEGELQTRNYTDKSGNKRKATEVNVSRAYFVGKNDGSGNQQSQDYSGSQMQQGNEGDFAPLDDEDNQLPF